MNGIIDMKHASIRLLVTLIVVLILNGCMPAPYIYHEPRAEGGELVHSVCHHLAPRDTIEFQVEGISTQVRGQNNWLSINIYIPEGKSARFVSDEIMLFEDKPENARAFRISRSSYYDGQPTGYVTIKPTDLLIGHTKPLVKYGFAGDRLFEMSVKLDKRERDHFYVRLPALQIGEHLHEFPTIEFTKKTGVGIMSVNC
ncbi:MAG: hypothetical protein A4E64_00103 [Syntrophorhabdus sp. PtaU1.Bin058]|nr:MAG: hypothetical protein A4E64_00103 [Syntrophorhabdus sp. PtaU1.Bin058]